MAVDHYMAIYNPLCYPIVMSQRACIQLVAGSYIMGCTTASVHTGFTFSLVFCKGNTISHFFCDVPPVLALSCSNTDINIMLILVFVGFKLTFTVSAIIISYMSFLAALLRISSNAGKKKAFSACASHLTAVIIFYGKLSHMYLQSYLHNSHENRKVASVFYGIMIPMLNPLIYSLRNKEVKEFWKSYGKNSFSDWIQSVKIQHIKASSIAVWPLFNISEIDNFFTSWLRLWFSC